MTWEAFHRRGDVLRALTNEVNARIDGHLPMEMPGVAETFADELDVLGSLQLRWHTMLSGRIETGMGDQPVDLERVVIEAWRESADALPGIRAVLDQHLAAPATQAIADAMRTAADKEHQMMALMAGRASHLSVEEYGARVGASIEQKAREGYVLPAPVVRAQRASFMDRLRAALAA